MCGIGGIISRPGSAVDPAKLEALTRALNHRGPDGHGSHVHGNVALVHTRLAIVDLTAAGNQPMLTANGKFALTYNGEVFNHSELRSLLPDVEWRGTCDTETVAELLAHEGAESLPRLNGLFALALHDLQSQKLLLARDRWGVKPLYLYEGDGTIAFASELTALMSIGVPREIDSNQLRECMTGWAHGRWTPLAGVTKLLPGELATIDPLRMAITRRQWFKPSDKVSKTVASRLSASTPEENLVNLDEALRLAVERRLMSDAPLGTMCSGGVDSSLITMYAKEQRDVVAYCASVTDQPRSDEVGFAREVTSHLGVDLEVIPLSGESWRRDLVRTVRHVGYPLTHANSVPMYQIAAAAHRDGVKVLLSGEGADELFGGYGYLHRRLYRDFHEPVTGLRALARAGKRTAREKGWLTSGESDPIPGFTPQVRRFQDEIIQAARSAYRHHGGPTRSLEAALLGDLSLYLPHLLNRQDKCTMQASVETRVPFLDPDFVEIVLNLPLHQRIEPRRKEPLKRLAESRLPPGIADRPKMGFGFSVADYLDGRVRASFVRDGYLRDCLGRDRETWEAHCSAASGLALLLLWTGEIWCRAFVDGQQDDEIDSALWI